jgi:hypothetical protein
MNEQIKEQMDLTPYEKYESLVKLTHKLKRKSKLQNLSRILKELESHCFINECHLLNALSYSKKILRKKHGK